MAGQRYQENEIDDIYSGKDSGGPLSEMGKGAKKIGKYAGGKAWKALLSVLSLKAVIIALCIAILFIIIVGIASFIMMGPESVRGKFVEMVDDMWSSIEGIFVGKAKSKVKKEQIINVAQYLDNMGYKLEGYGFGDVKRDENGKLIDIDSKYLLAYLAAENKTYMIANDEFNFSDFFSNITNLSDGAWGSGMIVINQALWNTNIEDVEIDRKAQTMNIHIRGSSEKLPDKIYQYNLDGWMGRYGKPIEFLLALHVGTMAPDFAYQVAVGSEFNTKVYVKFKKVGVTTRVRFTRPNGSTGYVISFQIKDENGKVVKEVEGLDKYIAEVTKKMRDEFNKYNNQRRAAGLQPVNVNIDEEVKGRYGINNQDILKIKKYEEDNTYWIYKPYIIGVTNHWFRDLDFSKAYVQGKTERVNVGQKNSTFNVDSSKLTLEAEEEREGEIYQKYEPRVVGKDKTVTFEQLIYETKTPTNTTKTTTGSNTSTTGTQTTTPSNEDNKSTDTTAGSGNLPLYFQDDDAWKDYPYGDYTMARCGCGPTCLAMLATWATGQTVMPVDVAYWLDTNNHYQSGDGTTHEGMEQAAAHWGFTLTKIYSQSEVIDALKSGLPVLAAHSAGYFTGGGHFMVYAYIDSNGKLVINNPNSTYANDGPYDIDFVLNESADWWIPSGYKVGGKITGTGSGGSTATPNNGTTGTISTAPGNEYEGHRLDELFKDTYYIANGIDGLSKEKKKIDAKNTMRYAITMLENVHSQDAKCILRDLKRYLSKRGFVFNDQYVITDPKEAEKNKYNKDEGKLEYGGTAYTRKSSQTATSSGGSSKPLGGILDGNTGGVEISEDDLTITLHHKSANNADGFETGATVKSPGAGEVVAVSGDTVRIKLTTSGAQGKTITISGFKVDPSVRQGFKVSMGQQIGVTTESDITVTMVDEQGKQISPKDYLPIISADQNDVETLAKCLAGEAYQDDYEGMAAVAWTIINRKNSSAYPDTIYEVIWQGEGDEIQYKGRDGEATNITRQVARNCLSGLTPDPVSSKLRTGPAMCFRTYPTNYFTTERVQSLENQGLITVCGGNVFFHSENEV